MNRLANSKNPYQGESKRVLCVCSAGLLRSPTTARVLTEEYGYNTRAAGVTTEYALIPVDDVLIEWADEIVCMSSDQEAMLMAYFKVPKGKIYNLEIPDIYGYYDDKLVALIKERYEPSN